jgi:hypothetical protein
MRPNLAEQLAGLRRILAEIIAPEIKQPYPAGILAGVIASLDALQSALPSLPDYLRWDIQSTGALLNMALPHLDENLTAEVKAALADAPGARDLPALESCQENLRALLVGAIPAILADPALEDVKMRMMDFFHERADRYPFSITGGVPAKSADVKTGA